MPAYSTAVDDYRWLEDWNNREVREWSDAQNIYARNILDHLESRDAIRARVSELRTDQAESYFGLSWRAGRLFEVGENAYAVLNAITDFASHPPANRHVHRDRHSLQRLAGTWLSTFSQKFASQAAIRRHVAADASSGPTTLFDARGRLKSIGALTPEEEVWIAGFEVIIKNAAAGDGHTDTVHNVKVQSQLGYVELAARHLGMLNDKIQVGLSDTELLEALAYGRQRRISPSITGAGIVAGIATRALTGLALVT